jgi:putative hydrolase of the HAD superfamily
LIKLNNIKWVIFDLGGVVVKLNIEGAWNALAQRSETDVQALKSYLSSPDESGLSINAKLELGFLSVSEYVQQVSRVLNKSLSEEELVALKMLIIQGEDAETLELIAALSTQKKLACFSNTHEIHWNYMTRHYRAFQFFQKTIASHLIHAAKPDPSAFAIATKHLNADPPECLFIDDSLANAEAARAFGWHAIHFQNHASLREELSCFGFSV